MVFTLNFHKILHTMYKYVLNSVVKISLMFVQYFDYTFQAFFRGHVVEHLLTADFMIILYLYNSNWILFIICHFMWVIEALYAARFLNLENIKDIIKNVVIRF